MSERNRPSVLIVEDEAALQALLRAVLGSEWNIKTAANGKTALDLAGEFVPDIVLLDIGLPDLDGLEVCRQLKSDPRLEHVPVIFLTARTSGEDEIDGLQAGGNDYIAKPINPAVLKARIRTHLELKQNRDELLRLARTDGLTGLYNRRSFDDLLNREWRRLARTGEPLSVIMIDVDHFKLYNDTYGHGGGDLCLQRVARASESALQRPADVVARYGGEEFVALLPETKLEGAMAVAEAIRAAVAVLEIPHKASQTAPHITLSLGAACTIPQPDQNPAGLLAAADKQLYAAKSEGRNRARGSDVA
ncbi:MAG: diguanylate cyclase [Rhodospirillaceae bacterium]|nr:diguanylate cyclase [Rhodospirillaceae bacterium]